MLFSVFFCQSTNWTKKMGGSIWPPPGKPRIGQHPGKGGVKAAVIFFLLLDKRVHWCDYQVFFENGLVVAILNSEVR